MPKRNDRNTMPDLPVSNPSVNPKTGAINPSAPTVGTEQWGNTSDERRVLQQNEFAPARAGEKKKNAGDKMPPASQRQERRAGSNPRRDDETNQADLSRRTSASAHSMNTSQGGTARTFRCADAGHADCRWEAMADTEDEVVRQVEQHWREEHGLGDWTAAMRNRVRDNIRHRRAA